MSYPDKLEEYHHQSAEMFKTLAGLLGLGLPPPKPFDMLRTVRDVVEGRPMKAEGAATYSEPLKTFRFIDQQNVSRRYHL